jgi:long-chain acyl-CoA synthetase
MFDSVAAMFVSAARDYPDRTFLRWCHGEARITWSYAEAALRIDALVAQLDELGVKPGEHVVIHTHDMVPSILFDLACTCAGVVFTPIETSSLPAVLDVCTRTAARAVLTTPDRRGSAYDGRPVVVVDGSEPVTGDPIAAIGRLGERAARVRPESIYMLQPTSGTTGGPKLVIRDHATFIRIARLLGCGLERTSQPAERVLIVAALTHGMGQYLLAIAMGLAAELCVTTQIDTNAKIEEVRWLDPTYLGLTPRVMRSLVQQLGGVEGHDKLFGPSAKFVLVGGAAPDKDLLAAIVRTGVHVVEGFGASEMSVVAMTRPGQWRPDIVGHVVDDVTLKIAEDGELLAKTPVMMRGYYGSPELTRAAFTEDGYYRSGDRVTLGPENEFRYHGRMVDAFNLFDGSHVAPGPIEDAVTRLPWVDQVVLIGDQRPYLTGLLVPHPAVRAQVTAGAGSLRALIERDLGRICSELEPNARVRRVAVLDRPLPTEVHQVVGHGKVRRARSAAVTLLAETVQALYGGAVPGGLLVIEVPGAVSERRASSRPRRSWLVRVRSGDQQILAYTRDVGRGGAFVETDAAILRGAAITIEAIEAGGESVVLDAEVVRHEPSGVAIRWTGPSHAVDELARRLPP